MDAREPRHDISSSGLRPVELKIKHQRLEKNACSDRLLPVLAFHSVVVQFLDLQQRMYIYLVDKVKICRNLSDCLFHADFITVTTCLAQTFATDWSTSCPTNRLCYSIIQTNTSCPTNRLCYSIIQTNTSCPTNRLCYRIIQTNIAWCSELMTLNFELFNPLYTE